MGIVLPMFRESKHLKSKEFYYRHHSIEGEKCCKCKYIQRYIPTESKQVRYFCCHLDRQVASMNVCNAFEKRKIDITDIPSRKAKSRLKYYLKSLEIQELNKEKLKLNNDTDSSMNHKCVCIKKYSYKGSVKSDRLVIDKDTELYYRITKSEVPKRLIFENRKLCDGFKLYFLLGLRLEEFNKYFKVVKQVGNK